MNSCQVTLPQWHIRHLHTFTHDACLHTTATTRNSLLVVVFGICTKHGITRLRSVFWFGSKSNHRFFKTSQVLGPRGQVRVMSQVSQVQVKQLSGLWISDSQYWLIKKLYLMWISDIMANIRCTMKLVSAWISPSNSVFSNVFQCIFLINNDLLQGLVSKYFNTSANTVHEFQYW